MNSILTYGVVVLAVSVLMQWLKQYANTTLKKQLILLGLSLVGGGVYLFFQSHTNYWLVVVKVVAGADVIYSFLIQYLEGSATTTPPTPAV